MSVINTNITSMISQKNLNTSKNALTTAMERLSSGMRINSAKDDAAGQAIANRMTSQVKGLAQAQRNANDGISVAQTAEGALNQINENLQRIRELTVQSANGTNSKEDLDSIQNEIGQRLTEIDRISEETSFNGVKVLASDQDLKIQVGANDNEVIKIGLKQIDRSSLSLTGFNINDADVANTAATDADLTADGFTSTAGPNGTDVWSKSVTTANTAATAADALKSLVDTNSVSTTATTTGLGVAATGNNYTYNAATESFSFDAAGVASANIDTYIQAAATAAGSPVKVTVTLGGNSQVAMVASDGSMKTESGQTLFWDGSNNLTTTDAGGATPAANISNVTAFLGAAGTGNGDTISLEGTTFTGTAAGVDVTNATISKTAFDGLDVAFTTSTGYSVAAGAAGAVTLTATGTTVNKSAADGSLTTDANTVVTTTYYEQTNGMITDGQGAQLYKDAGGTLTFDAATAGTATANPLAALDNALKKVDELRSDLGAIQNRFDSAITNLKTNETNLTAARSRIEDADYAVEVANMTRAQILQQAGTSVLAQANQVPQGVLSLLR
ncbi:MAG: flagellin FliC [Pseudomonas sp.]|nr:flagellin FliC [Pseudomonas sp.]